MLRKIHYFLLVRWWKFSIPIRLRRRGVIIGNDVVFYGMPIVSMAKNSNIILGNRVVLVSRSEFTALGVSRPCILRTLSANATIQIDDDVGMSGGVVCAANSVKIGKQCLLGADVMIMDTDFHPKNPLNRRYNTDADEINIAPVVIEDNVFIGTRSVIKGVKIGSDSVIGAGSIVVSNVESGTVYAGNPARKISELS